MGHENICPQKNFAPLVEYTERGGNGNKCLKKTKKPLFLVF